MDNWYYLRGIDITPEKVNTTPHMLFERKNVYRIIIFLCNLKYRTEKVMPVNVGELKSS